MAFAKKLLKRPATQIVLAWVFASYIRLVFFTSSKRMDIHPDAAPYMLGDANAIFAFWHGRMMMLPTLCPPKHTMRVLISLHRDGLLISRTIGHFGQKTVTGSTSRGGREAVLEMLRALEAGDNISITPDGPRGPAQVLAKGTIGVAKYAQKPILPVTFSATRAVRLGSWDSFLLALPFGRIVFCIGKPIMVAENGDEQQDEQMRQEVEAAMNRLAEHADGEAHG